MIPDDYKCEGQMNLFDFTNAHTLQVLRKLRAEIEWRKDHTTTNLAESTYLNCLRVIDEAIEEESK